MKSKLLLPSNRSEEGVVLAFMALVLVVMLTFAGFALDLGLWYARATKIQNTADAAALAGSVWLPNLTKANGAAKEVIEANGFDTTNFNSVADPSVPIRITTQGVGHTMTVEIEDTEVATVLTKTFLPSILIGRTGIATYAPPVPLGSPTNFFGMGDSMPGVPPEEQLRVYASVNGWCTSREHGDRYLSRWDGNNGTTQVEPVFPGAPTDDGSGTPPPWTWWINYCDPADSAFVEDNPEYLSEASKHYRYIIDIPSTRSAPTEVFVYDGAWSPWDDSALSPSEPVGHEDVAGAWYDYDVVTTWEASGPPTWPDYAKVDTVFKLWAPDGTPLDDADNPEMGVDIPCGAAEPMPYTFTNDTSPAVYDTTLPHPIAGTSNRWRKLCTIPSGMTGQFVLQVRSVEGQPNSSGQNNYGVALGDGAGNLVPCDSRDPLQAPTCARIYAKDAMAIYNASPDTAASFFLAEIDAIHAGKELRVFLWDPGEGALSIEVLDPDGNAYPFDYSVEERLPLVPGSPRTPAPGNKLDVTGTVPTFPGRTSDSMYNDQLVILHVQLPADYSTRYPTDDWWKIRYTSTSAVNDHTTWSIAMVGDPVHLIND